MSYGNYLRKLDARSVLYHIMMYCLIDNLNNNLM